MFADEEVWRARGNRAEGTAHGVGRIWLGVEGVDVRHSPRSKYEDDRLGFESRDFGVAGKRPQVIQVAHAKPEQTNRPGLNSRAAAENRVNRAAGLTTGGISSIRHHVTDSLRLPAGAFQATSPQ